MGYTVITDGKRKCISCGEKLDLSMFHAYAYVTRQGKKSTRTNSACCACKRTERRNREKLDSSRRDESHRLWMERNPEHRERAKQRRRSPEFRAYRRASEARRRFTADVDASTAAQAAWQILEDYRVGNRWIDVYTGKLIDNPTIDHVEPISRGGSHGYENLCVTSRRNNISKHTLPLLVWLIKRGAR